MPALASIITVLAAPFLIIWSMLWLSSRQPRLSRTADRILDEMTNLRGAEEGGVFHVTGDML